MYQVNEFLDDYWSFDSETSLWKNSRMIADSLVAVYGTRGTPNPDNQPGNRYDHSMVYDVVEQVIYLFGGYKLDNDQIAGMFAFFGVLSLIW